MCTPFMSGVFGVFFCQLVVFNHLLSWSHIFVFYSECFAYNKSSAHFAELKRYVPAELEANEDERRKNPRRKFSL